jgi:hypothetical protein
MAHSPYPFELLTSNSGPIWPILELIHLTTNVIQTSLHYQLSTLITFTVIIILLDCMREPFFIMHALGRCRLILCLPWGIINPLCFPIQKSDRVWCLVCPISALENTTETDRERSMHNLNHSDLERSWAQRTPQSTWKCLQLRSIVSGQ